MIQLQFLNYLLDTKDSSLITLNSLDNSFFSDYQSEFNYIQKHLSTFGNVPDKATFLSEFPHFDVINVNETPKYLIDALYNDRNKRSLAFTFNKVRELLQNNKVEEATQYFLHSAENQSQAKHLECVDIIKDVSRYDAYVERSKDFSKYYVKTCFKELDDILGGWDRQEELATIVARPGVGKSWILLKVAIAAAEQGLNVGIYSGEMSENKVGYRIDTLLSHISNRSIMKGIVDVQNEYKRHIDNISNYIKGSIKVITPAMIGGTAGVTALRAFIEKENLDMLCVDQHSLLDDDRHGKTPIEKASNISKDLKNLQVLKKIPIIAVSQQNRSSVDEGETYDVSKIAQADRIGQDSTVVLFLEQSNGILTVHIAKARDATTGGKIKYAIDIDKGVFQYMPNEDDVSGGESCNNLRDEFEGPSYEESPF